MLDYSWLLINQTWLRIRIIANIDAAKKPRLANADRYAHIGGLR
jgi:hypothetical protein